MKIRTITWAGLLALGILTGCAGSPSEPDTKEESLSVLEQLKGTFLSEEVLILNASITELNFRCFAENGYPDFAAVLPAQKANMFRTLPPSLDFGKMFDDAAHSPWFDTLDDAQSRGYGRNAAGLDPRVRITDPAFRDVAKQCADRVQAQLPGSHDILSKYADVGMQIVKTIQEAGARGLKDSSGKVFECMAKENYAVSPSGPNKMDPWEVDFGITLGTQTPEKREDSTPPTGTNIAEAFPRMNHIPSSQEKDSAATMFNCSIDTGAGAQWKESVDDAMVKTLNEHKASLESMRSRMLDVTQTASDAVK